MAYYGVGDGWCFSCGGFAGHVKVMFINGVDLKPVPPVTPVGMGKATRGVELESIEDIDARQLACALVNAATDSLIALRTLVSAEIHRYAERPQLPHVVGAGARVCAGGGSGFKQDLADVLSLQDPAVRCRCFGEGV